MERRRSKLSGWVGTGVCMFGLGVGQVAHAACSVSQLDPADGSTQIQSPTFRWSASGCSQYRVYFSPSGDYGADVSVTSWQTAKFYKMAEATWNGHQATDWSEEVSWKVEGQAADLTTVQTGSRTVLMDPNLDDDSASVAQGDCNDEDPLVYPGAPETCDGTDEDCDGVADDGLPFTTRYADVDSDGFGDLASPLATCGDPPVGYVVNSTDCDDGDVAVNPAAAEACNGIDDDCDGGVDELLAYPDVDLDGFGDDAGAVDGCAGPPVEYVDVPGDCNDADAAVNPAMAEVCDDGIDQDCDGGAGSCGIYGDMDSTTTADLSIPGYKRYALGSYPWDTGDLDGDGALDVLVSTTVRPYPRNVGAVYGFFGPLTASDRIGNADFRVYGDSDQRKLGYYAAIGGDFDGDGSADLIVSSGNSNESGTVYVFFGPIGGGSYYLDEADAVFMGYASSDNSVLATSVGDLDGDGRDEIAIAAPNHEVESDDGWVDIYYGPPSGTHVIGEGDLSYFGDSNARVGHLLRAGDVDGDGFGDLVIGASYDSFGRDGTTVSNGGTVFVCYGPDLWGGYLESDCPDRVQGAGASEYLGGFVANGGTLADVNGDGTDDLVLGTPSGGGSAHYGSVHVCFGPIVGAVNAGECDLVIESRSAGSEDRDFGSTVRAGDVDGDGSMDIVVADSAAYNSCNSTSTGSIQVYYGPFTEGPYALDTSDRDARIRNEVSCTLSESLGKSLAVGDFDGDGIDDILAGAPAVSAAGTASGVVRLWSGGGM
ncbi:FG-GAP-like repeat-containing protein [Myxococcota bacterium]|nr:FG-GAP-like repeat-containing protein [Myxococcota bacterium]